MTQKWVATHLMRNSGLKCDLSFSGTILLDLGSFMGHPKCQHFFLLLKFAFYNIILFTSVIITDILISLDFYLRGHYYWSLCTATLILVPFLARVVSASFAFTQSFEIVYLHLKTDSSRFQRQLQSIPEVLWHLPILSSIR